MEDEEISRNGRNEGEARASKDNSIQNGTATDGNPCRPESSNPTGTPFLTPLHRDFTSHELHDSLPAQLLTSAVRLFSCQEMSLILQSLLAVLPSATAVQNPLGSGHNNIAQALAGNPVFPGWYADPEARIFNNRYWIYPTYSALYEEQTFFDAFSSPDLLTWTKHHSILNISEIPWSTNRAAWAPSVARRRRPENSDLDSSRNGRDGTAYDYFMYFSVGDGAGIGVAKSTTGRPEGPFEDAIGEPLVPETVFGAEAIDAQLFQDDADGRVWLYYGGWSHAIVVELNDDMISLKGDYLEITPEGYVEGPWMLKRNGIYYFMYSVGG